ncbi:hypothetical protein AC480_00085 [miscellaneous Crenarchaeota group archaeon SMTZ1-55]|nr:MAG: hypothetical protein AC480_00085 [miscellaneous Crenarchaeota group archaeon SMTZ1-55]
MYWKIILTVIVLSFMTTPATAGRIDPDLEQRLNSSSPGEKVPVLVLLTQRLDTGALKASLHASKASKAERHLVVVEELKNVARSTQSRILRYLWFQRLLGRVEFYRAFWIDNIVAVRATPRVIRRLATRPDVARISYDHPLELIDPVEVSPGPDVALGIENGIALTRAPELWANGIDGTGTLACHLDTGVDGHHPALESRWRGLDLPPDEADEAWFDPVTNTDFPFDAGSHGTHTMGTICGLDGANQIGMAPGAKWISAGVIDRVDIDTTVKDAIAAFQWAADPDGDPGTIDDVPDVVSNSWGLIPYTHGYPDCDPLFNAVIDNLELAGPVVVFAAGNEGSGGLRIPADRITTPVNTFAVGALNQDGTSIASFSSRGPSGCDNRTLKPEITAVGNNVRSCVPGGGYSTMSGTSMACPHVAGAVLLLRQVKSEATVEEIKYALYLTAVDLGHSGEDNTFGMGRIDVVEAKNALRNGFGTIEGYVNEAGTGAPIEGAVVRLDGTSIYGVTDETGYYSILAPAGTTYQVVASAFGYKRGTESVDLPVDPPVTANFWLEAAEDGTLQGTVTDSDGVPLDDVTISFLNAPLPSIETDDDGFYQIMLPGDYAYDIKAEKPRYDSEYAYYIFIPEEGVVMQDFELERGLCFLNAAARGTAVEADLDAYRKARKLLSEGSPLGTEVLHLYQEHTAQIAAILLHNPALRVELRSMISRFAPIVRLIAQGEDPDRPVLSDEDEATIHALLDEIELVASPRLKAAIKSVRTDIRTLKGMTIGQVRSSLR